VVIEAHTESLPAGHRPVGSMLFHAVLHDLAETHLAEMGGAPARRLLRRHPRSDEGRHAVIHALGAELAQQMLPHFGCSPPPGKERGDRRRRGKLEGREPELTSE